MERALKRKLEQLDPEEQEKLRQLLRDKHTQETESEGSKLGWMYKQDRPDQEEYLLGRQIDKHIDNAQELEDQAVKETPGAIFADAIARRADLDMHAKMREDPLYAIRKKEEDARRRIVENPIKMKQLQKMVEEQEKKELKKKKRKKHKKHHKKADSSESDSDNELLNQYLAIVKSKEEKGKHESRGRDSSDKHSSSDTHKAHRHRSPQHNRQADTRRRHHSDSDSDTDRKYKYRNKQYGLLGGEKSLSPKRRKSRSRSRSPKQPQKVKSKDTTLPQKREPKKKLSSSEMDRRRQEMMENAKWRDEQRESNVAKYREEDRKETESAQKQKQKSDGSNFLNPLMMKHATSSSVEDRLKRNKYNIQRTKADLDKNFTKH